MQSFGVQIGKYLLGLSIVGLIFSVGLSQVTEYSILKPIVSDVTKKLLDGNPGNIAYIYSEQMNSFLKTVMLFLAIGVLAGVIIIYFSTRNIFLSLDNIGKTLLKSGIPFLFLMILNHSSKPLNQ